MSLCRYILILLFIANNNAVAVERILSYHSDIRILADSSMEVVETIQVKAEARNIKRGIYRDFLTTYKDKLGNRYKVGFEIREVLRDGMPEPHHTAAIDRGVRLYVGSSDVFLQPGLYEYKIHYMTNRQLGFFESHDELYWNVTGTDWLFTIEQASASVALPSELDASQLNIEGYVGSFGAAGEDYTARVDPNGKARIATTRRLNPEEGLTLVFTWPKGIVQEPSSSDKLFWLLRDNLGLLIILLGVGSALAYLFYAWHKVGRDPLPGVIFPHYEPPEGYSPGSIRFVSRMGYDQKTFGVAILNLAVSGHLKIKKVDDTYELEKTHSSEPMGVGEKVLYEKLFSAGSRLLLETANHRQIRDCMVAHGKALQLNFSKIFFLTNTAVLLPALVLLLLAVIIVVVFAEFNVTAGIVLGTGVAALVVFAYLLKAPTKKGRKLLDQAEGFKHYLEIAEKDELKLRNPPEKTAALFESYLPYALALGVEQPWAERFAAVFAGLQQETGTSYQPSWYQGHWNNHDLSGFTKTISSDFSSAIASAAAPPGSSSGSGGGGFSGGGGGGGGGGGW